MTLFMSYEKAKEVLAKLEQAVIDTQTIINGYPKDRNGIIPDLLQYSHEYRYRKRQLENQRNALEEFTKRFQKEFREEIKAEKINGSLKN